MATCYTATHLSEIFIKEYFSQSSCDILFELIQNATKLARKTLEDNLYQFFIATEIFQLFVSLSYEQLEYFLNELSLKKANFPLESELGNKIPILKWMLDKIALKIHGGLILAVEWMFG